MKQRSFAMRVVAVLWLAACAPAAALTLGEAVELALRNDPAYLAAQSGLEAARARSGQTRAALLPQLSAMADTNANRRSYILQNATRSIDEHYNSNSAQLRLVQAVWKHADRIAFGQSELAASQAAYQLEAAQQDLLVRLAQSWFDAMQARDGVMLGEAQVRMAEHQLELARRGNEKGVVSQAELEDMRSKREQALAERSTAENELGARLAVFEAITGPVELRPPTLAEQFEAPALQDEKLESWLERAERDNPAVLAADMAMQAAAEEVRKQRAGHEPTLELVASHARSAQGSGSVVGQSGFTSTLDTLGLQLNLPLFEGGGQDAKVREALAMKSKAEHEREYALRNARKDAKQAWFSLRAGKEKLKAARQGVDSAAFALKAAEAARDRGVKAELDVLHARQQQAAARRDWRRACYDLLLGHLRLRAAAGVLARGDLDGLDKVFE